MLHRQVFPSESRKLVPLVACSISVLQVTLDYYSLEYEGFILSFLLFRGSSEKMLGQKMVDNLSVAC